MSNKLGKADYEQLAASRGHRLISFDGYKNVHSTLSFECLTCGTCWEATGHSYKNAKKSGCPGCKKITTSKNNSGKIVSAETRAKIGVKASQRPGSLTGVTGSAHPRYTGAIGRDLTSPSNMDYEWKSGVKKRCKYTCVVTRVHTSTGAGFAAHHLNGYDTFVDQRYLLTNGVYLQKHIHKEFHDLYGYGNNTEAQFAAYCEKTHGFNWYQRKKELDLE
jgi:hypothetical protein